MWRERIIEEMTAKNISKKTMAERMETTEKTVSRLLSDKSKSPYITTVLEAGAAVGLSPIELFAETGLIVGSETLAKLQTDIDRLNNEVSLLQAELAIQKDKVCILTTENDMLRMKLEHKEEIISLHNYYIKKSNG